MKRYTLSRDADQPYAITIDDPGREEFFRDLLLELQLAISARNEYIKEGGLIDQWWAMYEQTPDYAKIEAGQKDFASWIPTVDVDSLADRVNQVVFGVEPICMVEGWPDAPGPGAMADAAAKVEAFHEWQADNERLRLEFDKIARQALVEGNGILEVAERRLSVKNRKTMKAAVLLNEHGDVALDAKGRPQPRRDASGQLVPYQAQDPQYALPGDAPSLDVSYDEITPSQGPTYAAVSLKDFLYLPVHAKNLQQVYGFARRFYMTVADCLQLEQNGVYQNVEKLGTMQERLTTDEDRRQGQTAQDASTPERAMKELWQVSLYVDIDGDQIPEWVIATVSIQHQVGIQLAYDDLAQRRYIDFTPCPRSNSVWGMSYVAKLWTVADEHTCWRNLSAEAATRAVMAPILRQRNSPWKPEVQPWGTEEVIDVATMTDIMQFRANDVPEGVFLKTREIEDAAERVSGLNDVAMLGGSTAGPGGGGHATATEVQTDAHASYVRVQAVISRAQEFVEDWYGLRHVIWTRALQSGPLRAPAGHAALRGLQSRGIFDPAKGPPMFTAADLAGTWRFKPRGSVETADIYRLRDDFIGFSENVLPALMKLSPAFAQFVATNPAVIKALMQDATRLFRMEGLQTVINMFTQAMQQAQQAMQQAQQAPQPQPGSPGMPPGAPPGLPGQPMPPGPPSAPPTPPQAGPMIPGAPGNPSGIPTANFAPVVMPSIAVGSGAEPS